MPRSSLETYRIAFAIALVVALVAAIFGALPIAILVAAFAVPLVYIVYLYDVNLWDDEPLPVTGLAFGLTGILTIAFMIIIELLRGPAIPTAALDGTTLAAPSVWTFLLLAVLVPVVGEAIRQVGPLVLASRPEFDDLMDGLTFGVISGVSFACFDTIIRYWDLLTGGLVEQDPGLWVSLIFLHGFVKPLLIGTATGIACAEYSGLGRGYDGFTPRYYRGLALAIGINIAFQAAVYLFSFVGDDTLAVILSLGSGTAAARDRDLADAYGPARRTDGSGAGANGARRWARRRRRTRSLRQVRTPVARSRGVLHRLRHRRSGPEQAAPNEGPGGCGLRTARPELGTASRAPAARPGG